LPLRSTWVSGEIRFTVGEHPARKMRKIGKILCINRAFFRTKIQKPCREYAESSTRVLLKGNFYFFKLPDYRLGVGGREYEVPRDKNVGSRLAQRSCIPHVYPAVDFDQCLRTRIKKHFLQRPNLKISMLNKLLSS